MDFHTYARVFSIFIIFNYLESLPAQCLCGIKSLNGTFVAVNAPSIAVIYDIYYGWCVVQNLIKVRCKIETQYSRHLHLAYLQPYTTGHQSHFEYS